MTYEEAEEYIRQTNICGSVYGLDVMYELLARLGNPQEKLRVIHVAGTNGKGSICAFLGSILEHAGYTVGRYVSPTIFTYLERFQINGAYMQPDEFARILEPVKAASDAMETGGMRRPTSYETETAAAFVWFLERNVDFLLLETGMGGLEDATNVCAHPVCTVIASISMDHMQQLGDTLPEIYRHKLGIMKRGVPCVAYPVSDELMPLWVQKCEQSDGDIPSVMLDTADIDITACDESGSSYLYRGERYDVSVPGIYQIYNSAVAVQSAKLLQRLEYGLKNVDIYNGIRESRWQGRFQKISDEPEIYVDGAHNAGGWRVLRASMDRYFAGRDIIHVCGVLKDKDYRSMLDIMLRRDKARCRKADEPRCDYNNVSGDGGLPKDICFIALQSESPRALDCNMLAELAKDYINSVYVQPDATKAVKLARDIALAGSTARQDNATGKLPVIMVYGSLSFLGPVIENFRE